jgi:dienelactone hydrolase
MTKVNFLLIGTLASILLACNNESTTTAEKKDTGEATTSSQVMIKEEAVTYAVNGTTLKGYIAYDENKPGTRPIVLVVPEWWGLTEYPRLRAKMLAEMGYLAIAVDMYGDGKLAENPEEAQREAMPFYPNPHLGKERLDAALVKAKTFAMADTTQVAAIGYCFGGSMVLNYAKMGAPLAGVVSFHGNLEGAPATNGIKTRFLICHGAADNFVPQLQVDAFKKSMDSAGISYTFKTYENATHAFTNPKATEMGAKFKMPIQYDAAADTASWNDMKTFLGTVLR